MKDSSLIGKEAIHTVREVFRVVFREDVRDTATLAGMAKDMDMVVKVIGKGQDMDQDMDIMVRDMATAIIMAAGRGMQVLSVTPDMADRLMAIITATARDNRVLLAHSGEKKTK